MTILTMLVALTFTQPASAAPARWTQLETASEQAQKELLAPWAKAWKAKDAKAYAALFADGAASFDWRAPRSPVRERDGIQESRWKTQAPAASGAGQLAEQAGRYLDAYAKVEDVSFAVLDAAPLADGGYGLSARFDLRGKTKDGALRTDRGVLSLQVDRAMKLRRVEPVALETLAAREPAFSEATREAGLSGVPVLPRAEAIRRGGYALAVGDYDGDGRPDLYVGGSGPGMLFHNEGGGKFKDATAAAGLDRDTLVKSALFADMDNSGRTSLVLQRFVTDGSPELVFYRNAGDGRFEKAPAVVDAKHPHDRPMSMAAADFNGDGLLDLYVGYPGTRDFTDGQLDSKPAVVRQAIYLNKGGWRFEELDNPKNPEFHAELVRPHSALEMDISGRGRADLIVIDDRGDPSRLYLNNGDGTFADGRAVTGLKNDAWGMVAAGADLSGQGRDSLYFSNIDFSAGRRIVKLVGEDAAAAKDLPGYDRLKEILSGNRLYSPEGGASLSFKDVTEHAGLGWAGEAPAGATWIDYNNDGLPDLYVVNGLWSADPDQDESADFIKAKLAEDPNAKSEVVNSVMKGLQASGKSLAGYQRNRLFRNNGDGTFTEVGYVTGADRAEDGYVAAVADLDGRGLPDLVLRNADPASAKYAYAPVVVLKNRGLTKNKMLAVHLKGVSGASAAFGARVTIEAGGKRQSQIVRAVQGCVQAEQAAFFGVGAAKKIDLLEVAWPDGVRDTYTNVRPGKVVVREGQNRLTAR